MCQAWINNSNKKIKKVEENRKVEETKKELWTSGNSWVDYARYNANLTNVKRNG